MARRRPAPHKPAPPDPKYGSPEVSRFINRLMQRGKKSTARRVLYGAFSALEKETNRPAPEVFEMALRNCMPMLEVKPRRVGGATYQVPVEIRPSRRMAMAQRWLIDSARARGGKPMAEKLYAELLDASRGQGNAAKKREDLHRMAEANRAFAHYRW